MSARWQYWACENASQPVNKGSQRGFGRVKNGTYFKHCKVIFMNRFKRDPWTKWIIWLLNFLTGFYNRMRVKTVIFYTCFSCRQCSLFILFMYVYIYFFFSIYTAGRTWQQSVVSGSGCPLRWPGVTEPGTPLQVWSMAGGASHSAERWMALFMLPFAAVKVDSASSNYFYSLLITRTGDSSCWIRQESWSLLLFWLLLLLSLAPLPDTVCLAEYLDWFTGAFKGFVQWRIFAEFHSLSLS